MPFKVPFSASFSLEVISGTSSLNRNINFEKILNKLKYSMTLNSSTLKIQHSHSVKIVTSS